MKSWFLIPVLVLLVGGCASVTPKGDSWTGRDKFHHFWVSGAISGIATAVVKDQDEDNADVFPVAIGVTLSFGIAKETHDVFISGSGWSWKDLVWDLAGALTGYAIVDAIEP